MVHSRDPVRVRAERRLNLYTRIIRKYDVYSIRVYAEKPIATARRVY